jgi:hypothetical protein
MKQKSVYMKQTYVLPSISILFPRVHHFFDLEHICGQKMSEDELPRQKSVLAEKAAVRSKRSGGGEF